MRRELGFGMMRLPLDESGKPALVDVEATREMADRFLENGFTYFDTAFAYHDGRSETVVKEVLTDRLPRESFQLATKLPLWLLENEEDMRRVFDEQFQKCGTEYFDRYLLHNVNGDSIRAADRLDAWSFVLREKEKGVLRSVGFSFHDDADLLARVLRDHPEMEFVQLQINYADWDDAAIQSRRCYEVARDAGIDIIVMEPVKGGLLADPPEESARILGEASPGASPASLALRYAANLEGVVMTLSGMHSLAQVEENAALFRDMAPLSEAEREGLFQAAKVLKRDLKVECTACGYCAGCPVNIPIPRYFALWNSRPEKEEGFSSHQMYYDNAVAQGYGRAEDCVRCRRCEEHCPQQLPIVEKMAELSGVFDAKQEK